MKRAVGVRSAVVLLVAVAITGVLFVDFCGWLYGCGCRSLLAGAAADCNVHHATGPRCPWCAHPLAGGAVAWLAVTGAQAAIVLGAGSATAGRRLLAALAAFPLVGAPVGLLQGWWWGYW